MDRYRYSGNFLFKDEAHNEEHVKHSSGDADYLIALTALEKLKSSNVVCITDDIDVLVLLLHCAESSQFNLYLEASSSNVTRLGRGNLRWGGQKSRKQSLG